MELKDRIKQKADELYRRYGIKSVTMDEIASQLGVSKKTIYQCYSDKNELVDAVISDIIEFNENYCLHSRHNAKNAIHEVFIALESMRLMFDNLNPAILFDIERNYPGTYRKFVNFKYHFLFEVIRKNIERGKEEGLYRQDVDAGILAKVRLECVLLPFNEVIFPKNEYTLLQVQHQIVDLFLHGMVTLKGYKVITRYKRYQQAKQEKNNL